MVCRYCGATLSDHAKFCKTCGRAQDPTNQAVQPAPGSGLVGFSARIQDPAFKKYVKNSNRWAFIFSLILAAVAIIGFFIYGETSSEMENPQALFIGIGVGGMFVAIAFFQILGRNSSKTWDGTVVDKKIEKKRRQKSVGGNDKEYYYENYILYTVLIRSEDGKKYKLSIEDSDTQYNYYQIGDRVRHHKGLNSYEKYDKSRDSIVFCNACASLNNIQDDCCFRCKCPLLK